MATAPAPFSYWRRQARLAKSDPPDSMATQAIDVSVPKGYRYDSAVDPHAIMAFLRTAYNADEQPVLVHHLAHNALYTSAIVDNAKEAIVATLVAVAMPLRMDGVCRPALLGTLLAVDPSRRGLGLARSLMANAINLTLRRGHALRVFTLASNNIALAPVACVPRFVWRFGLPRSRGLARMQQTSLETAARALPATYTDLPGPDWSPSKLAWLQAGVDSGDVLAFVGKARGARGPRRVAVAVLHKVNACEYTVLALHAVDGDAAAAVIDAVAHLIPNAQPVGLTVTLGGSARYMFPNPASPPPGLQRATRVPSYYVYLHGAEIPSVPLAECTFPML